MITIFFILKCLNFIESNKKKRQTNTTLVSSFIPIDKTKITSTTTTSTMMTRTTTSTTTTSFMIPFKSTSTTPVQLGTIWWTPSTTTLTKVTDCSSPTNLICNILKGSFKGSTFIG